MLLLFATEFSKVSIDKRNKKYENKCQTLDAIVSPVLLHKSGTIYLPPLKSHHHLTPSNVTPKHAILPCHNFLIKRLPCTSDLMFLTFNQSINQSINKALVAELLQG